VAARLGPGPAEQDERAHAVAGAVLRVHIAARDLQAGHLGVLVEVALVGALHRLRRDLVLQQVVLQRGEGGCLPRAQLRPQVVLRVQEDLPVGLPDPVVLHPGPPGPDPGLDLVGVLVGGEYHGLQVDQVPVEEELRRGDGLADP
jgi:hypothetical protein